MVNKTGTPKKGAGKAARAPLAATPMPPEPKPAGTAPAAAPAPATAKEIAKAAGMSAEKLAVITNLVERGHNYEAAERMVNSASTGTETLRKPELTDEDAFARTQQLDFAPRAGVDGYRLELQERLQDIEDAKGRVFFIYPLKLSKKMAKALTLDTLKEAQAHGSDEWTEQNQLELMIKIREAVGLADAGAKAE